VARELCRARLGQSLARLFLQNTYVKYLLQNGIPQQKRSQDHHLGSLKIQGIWLVMR
jgi:hypothetical protein